MSEKKCLMCGEMIKEEAKKCKHCGSMVAEAVVPTEENKHGIAAFVIGALLPIVGVITSLVGFAQKKTNAASLLVGSSIAWIIWYMIFTAR